jgi:Tfp pilus assembly protein PilV
MKKLKNKKGETLVEALISVLIVVICFLALQISIVTSGKINASAKEMVLKFQISSSDAVDENASVTIERKNASESITTKIQVKKTADGYYYY